MCRIEQEEYPLYAQPVCLETLRTAAYVDLGMSEPTAMFTDAGVSGLFHVHEALCWPADRLVTTNLAWAYLRCFESALVSQVFWIPICENERPFCLCPDRVEAEFAQKLSITYIVNPMQDLDEGEHLAPSLATVFVNDYTLSRLRRR